MISDLGERFTTMPSSRKFGVDTVENKYRKESSKPILQTTPSVVITWPCAARVARGRQCSRESGVVRMPLGFSGYPNIGAFHRKIIVHLQWFSSIVFPHLSPRYSCACMLIFTPWMFSLCFSSSSHCVGSTAQLGGEFSAVAQACTTTSITN